MFFRVVTAVVAVTTFLTGAKASEPEVSAASAILIDVDSERVLWSKNAQKQSLIASTTKIMTALIVAQKCDLHQIIRVSDEAVGVEGSSIGLYRGEQISVEALLYGMMLRSGNDAAAALAIHCAGSIADFSCMMNQKASEIGLHDTNFTNPHGLDAEDHYSTAYDLARLTAYALKDPVFRQVVSTKTIIFGDRTFTNHNKLLWQYDGAIGVKTGYTRSAGRILVSAAERDDRLLVAVTINAPDDWRDHSKMLDYGFEAYHSFCAIHSGEAVAQVPVMYGASEYACVSVKDDVFCAVGADERVSVDIQLPSVCFPPVSAGDKAGVAIIMINGKPERTVPLIWMRTVLEGA